MLGVFIGAKLTSLAKGGVALSGTDSISSLATTATVVVGDTAGVASKKDSAFNTTEVVAYILRAFVTTTFEAPALASVTWAALEKSGVSSIIF